MNNASFLSFNCEQDLDALPAGTQFTVTWRITNDGDESWDNRYKLVHINANKGSQRFGAPASLPFTDVASRATAEPGTFIDISLTLTAPALAQRRYFCDWQLQDSQGRRFGQILWLRLVTTTAPVATGGSFRSSNSKFIADHTIPDDSVIEEGSAFRKQWVVQNNGQRKWNNGYRLVYVNGDFSMAGTASIAVPEAEAGEEVVLTIDMVAPPGRSDAYISAWRLYDDRNIPFGETFWVRIISSRRPVGSLTYYSQNDPRWRDRTLGKGPKTLGQFGCLLTCCAMMLTGYGENCDPWELNNRINALSQNGFSGSNMYFVAPAVAYDHLKFFGNYKPYPDTGATYATYDSNLVNRIDMSLSRGHSVLIQVDFNPNNAYNPGVEQHWVMAIARRGDDYVVVDPLSGEQISLLSKYGRQNRPQDPNEALKGAIKSALFFQSTTRTIDFPSFGLTEIEAGMEGLTDIGGDDS
ncbi:MAG: hypothetical protein KDE28_06245 [Anaerolineales bacterium]|nr:hypothetical protein [Anaerolineales bacterium]